MFKLTESSVASASILNDNDVAGDGGAVCRLDMSRKSTKSKSQMKSGHWDNCNNLEEPKFLTSEVKEVFNCLKQAFIKVPILWYFDPECHIRIKTDALSYVIEEVLSQLTPNQETSNETIRLNIKWHSLTYFSKKMISAETQYKTYDSEFLAIVEVFMT